MKLIKFRIKNYKSIKDSGYCWIASDLTTLAGKNESGKTAILEALRDFDPTVETIPDGAVPLDESGDPTIEVSFSVEKELFTKLSKEHGITLDKDVRELILKDGLTLIKDAEGVYDLDSSLTTALRKRQEDVEQQCIKEIRLLLNKIAKREPFSNLPQPTLSGEVEAVREEISEFAKNATTVVMALPEETDRETVAELLRSLATQAEELHKDRLAERFLEALYEYLPSFIFFSDFDDILPFELPFLEAAKHKTVQDFAKVANLDLAKVVETTDTQRRRNMLSKCAAQISGNFMGYWGQDEVDLIAEADGDNLRLGIRESNNTNIFKPEQRSKGFQWFLSFYLRLSAGKGPSNVILIDEPGLYLHAKAQKDVLKVLEGLARDGQVIFSTHSPYLIDADRLDRLRLVLKDKRGSIVENKIHKSADIETLTPIITAIGLDLSQHFSIVGKRNVVVEGISDYYILQALKDYLPSQTALGQVNLIPCVGAQKVPQVISLLIGWDLEFVVVLDNDGEGKKAAKALAEKLSVDDKRIVFVSKKEGCSIEDLFTREDFNDFILQEVKNTDRTITNCRFLKETSLSKALLAKNFLERVKGSKHEVALSNETISNFEGLLSKIAGGFVKTVTEPTG